MCTLILEICRLHSAFRAFQIHRCPGAVATTGLPESTGRVQVANIPTFDAEEGCPTGPPKLCGIANQFRYCPGTEPGTACAEALSGRWALDTIETVEPVEMVE